MKHYLHRTFECWACRAVGKVVQVDGRLQTGQRLQLLQEERPTRCDLCSISDGIHAMHPLYDNPGRKGRQIMMVDPQPRLAWGHTLCCSVLGNKDLMYGCTATGYYEGMDEDESIDDDRSINPDLQGDDVDPDDFEEDEEPIHHFVYQGPIIGREKEDSVWTKAVKVLKKGLKCFVCGTDDAPDKCLRIPIQCCANEDDEHPEFRGRHPSLRDDETCTVALHVGCAKWGSNNRRKAKRVYFLPDDPEDDEKAISVGKLPKPRHDPHQSDS